MDDVPCDKFVDELKKRRDRSRYGAEEYPYMISRGSNLLHSSYFPYNSRITRTLLKNKHVMFIGDSLVRAMYKDMVRLLQTNELCDPCDLRIPNEDTIYGDKHIDVLELDSNRVFRQAREFQSNRHLVQFFFTTRAMRQDLEKTCLMMAASDEKPDVVVVHSGIWDVSRFPAKNGEQGRGRSSGEELIEEIDVAEEYFNRVAMFCRRMRVLLPPTSTVVWLLMPPGSVPEDERRGFHSYNRLQYNEIRMRLMEANLRTAQIVREAGFDVLDLSFHFRSSNYYVFRIKDGVHWNVVATRYMNQLLLGHLAMAWRLEKSVTRKWPQSIMLKSSRRDFRSNYFVQALGFLKDRNDWKHMNETVHQNFRALTLKQFDASLHEQNRGQMSLTSLIEHLRVLLTFHRFEGLTHGKLTGLTRAFGTLPAELSRYSQEDIVAIGNMIEKARNNWVGRLPNARLVLTHKRPHPRKSLLPTPPQNSDWFPRPPSPQPVPPYVPPVYERVPNRIAPAEPKTKRRKD